MEPEVTVVIPALNAGAFLPAQLKALAQQDYAGSWEIIVADNGSVDNTRSIVEESKSTLPNLRLVDASYRRGVASARNAGARAARGRYVAFCDADDVVSRRWLGSLVAAGRNCHLCYGRMEFFRDGSSLPSHEAGKSAVPAKLLTDPFAFLPFASGGNLLVNRSVLLALGGFKEDYGAGEDVDLCWRAQYAGFTLGTADEALISIRLRASPRDQFRQYFGYGKGEVHLYRDHATHGMPRSSLLRAFAVYAWLVVVGCVVVAKSDPFYRSWVNAAGRRCGRIVGSWRHRRLYL